VKPRAEQQPELGSFLVLAVVRRDRVITLIANRAGR
jgi:hypothetical protein